MIYNILVKHYFRVSQGTYCPNNAYKVWDFHFWTQIGRIMHQNMGFEITVARKITERKNTTLMILDLIKRKLR